VGLSWNQEAELVKAVVDARELLARWRDEGQTVAADFAIEQVDRRLDRDRVRRELQELIDGR
jgi:hypothetical protein